MLTATGLTLADLEALPADGRRHELIGGAIVMTPAPELAHQRASRRLQRSLEDALPGMEVWDAPVDLDLPDGQRAQPDLVVVERGRSGARLTLPVALVVEIVSPGSTTHDRVTKRATYAAAGIAWYWIVDLPRLVITCLVLREGAYELLAEAPVLRTEGPATIEIDVAALIEP